MPRYQAGVNGNGHPVNPVITHGTMGLTQYTNRMLAPV